MPLADLATADLAGMRALVLSPGIPHTFPEAASRRGARARPPVSPIIGDIELLARSRREARYVGITGTNGKSTTTALIGHILAGRPGAVAVGGNIGVPALPLDAARRRRHLCAGDELLPARADRRALAFDVAVLLNITPDHLDRHGGMDGYIAAKERIFATPGRRATAPSIGIDDEICRGIAARLAARRPARRADLGRARGAGRRLRRGWLAHRRHGGRGAPRSRSAAARASARPAQLAERRRRLCRGALPRARRRVAAAGIASFAGLAHRQESIAAIDGVR